MYSYQSLFPWWVDATNTHPIPTYDGLSRSWFFSNIHEITAVNLLDARRIYMDKNNPDSKIHEANMDPTWVLSAPDGPHVGPMNLAICVSHRRTCICLGSKRCRQSTASVMPTKAPSSKLGWLSIHLCYSKLQRSCEIHHNTSRIKTWVIIHHWFIIQLAHMFLLTTNHPWLWSLSSYNIRYIAELVAKNISAGGINVIHEKIYFTIIFYFNVLWLCHNFGGLYMCYIFSCWSELLYFRWVKGITLMDVVLVSHYQITKKSKLCA